MPPKKTAAKKGSSAKQSPATSSVDPGQSKPGSAAEVEKANSTPPRSDGSATPPEPPVVKAEPSAAPESEEVKTLDSEMAKARAEEERRRNSDAAEAAPDASDAADPPASAPPPDAAAEAPAAASERDRIPEAEPPRREPATDTKPDTDAEAKTSAAAKPDEPVASDKPASSAEEPAATPETADESRPAADEPPAAARSPASKEAPSSQPTSPTVAKKESKEQPQQRGVVRSTRPEALNQTGELKTPKRAAGGRGSPAAAASVNSSHDRHYLADLGTVTNEADSPLAHLLCHGPPKRHVSPAGPREPLPPMRHSNPTDVRESSPGARHVQITVDPAQMEKAMEEKKRAREMRRERKRKEKERLAAELAVAEAAAEEARLQRDRERQRREEELKDRLGHLRERRAQRELDFLVSEKRAQQVRASKSLADVIQEQYDAKQRAEEEERQRQLQERRERMHAPVLTGVEAVQRHFRIVEERRERKNQELREQREVMERSAEHEPYHGRSYEQAAEEFVRVKHGADDAKHQRLYKHAKMQEYGNLVKRLYGPKAATPQPDRPSATPQPFVTTSTPNATGTASAVQAKASLPPLERNKAGNQYLREALTSKTPLPPGLKVAPLQADEDDFKRFKDRKKKGDAYLREVRSLPLKRSQSSPQVSREDADQQKQMELRRLKAQTASLESRLRGARIDLEDPEQCQETNEQFLEVVRLKLEMLRKTE